MVKRLTEEGNEKKKTFKGLSERSKEGGKAVIKKCWGQCRIKKKKKPVEAAGERVGQIEAIAAGWRAVLDNVK